MKSSQLNNYFFSVRYLKKGMVFRSATLDNMSQEDVDEFIKAHDIKTILDLRSRLVS
jgi:protein tyrosine/serine phosphatase